MKPTPVTIYARAPLSLLHLAALLAAAMLVGLSIAAGWVAAEVVK